MHTHKHKYIHTHTFVPLIQSLQKFLLSIEHVNKSQKTQDKWKTYLQDKTVKQNKTRTHSQQQNKVLLQVTMQIRTIECIRLILMTAQMYYISSYTKTYI